MVFKMTDKQKATIEEFYEYFNVNCEIELSWRGHYLFVRYDATDDMPLDQALRCVKGENDEVLYWGKLGDDRTQVLDEFQIDGVTLREMIPDCKLISMC
jgi:hypothetical protein